MIQDIAPSVFSNNYKFTEPKDEDLLLVFGGMTKREDRVLLVSTEDNLQVPTWKEVKESGVFDASCTPQFLFSIDETDYYMLNQYQKLDACPAFGPYTYQPIRGVRTSQSKVLAFAVMTGYHLYDWYRSNRFCGKCGAKTTPFHKERAMKCTCCDNLIFPKICPAVIVAVKKGDQLLMSQYANRGVTKSYALIAGFCEIGETAEETVAREVMEEVGLKVKNIHYYNTQPWGFDADLLLGYTCEVDGNAEITLDQNELKMARFFTRDEIPYAGNQGNQASLTATMIEAFRTGNL